MGVHRSSGVLFASVGELLQMIYRLTALTLEACAKSGPSSTPFCLDSTAAATGQRPPVRGAAKNQPLRVA
jgi:hypothetical protein